MIDPIENQTNALINISSKNYAATDHQRNANQRHTEIKLHVQ